MIRPLEKRIGIIGGGQLGKMMILEAKRLGCYVVTLDPDPNCAAHSISDEHIVASLHDSKAINELSKLVDVITYEIENINAETLCELEDCGFAVYPSAKSLKIIQDKLIQKKALYDSGIRVPDFEKIADLEGLKTYAQKNGYPIMLKSRKGGYDGKGVYAIMNEQDLSAGFETLQGNIRPLMVEEFVDFEMEFSVIATRGIDGEKAVYPVSINVHTNNICDTTVVPSGLPVTVQNKIRTVAEQVMDVFSGVGTFGIEMYLEKNGEVSVNEVAPRPHNSGHYTIEGCRVNQFENHIRAIIGLPLGETTLLHNAVIMRNLLGQENGKTVVLGLEDAYKLPGVNVHNYGKPESRKGRKMGHYTVTANSIEQAWEIDKQASQIIKITGD